MNCKHFKELMNLFLDGYAKNEEIYFLEKHIDSCEECKNYFSKLKDYKENLKKLERKEIPLGFEKKVMERIEEKEKSKLFFKRRLFLELSISFILLFSIFIVYLNLNFPEEKIKESIIIKRREVKIKSEEKKEVADKAFLDEKRKEVKKEEEKVKAPQKQRLVEKKEEIKVPYAVLSEPPSPPLPKYETVVKEIGREELKRQVIKEKEIIIKLKEDDFLETCKKIEEYLSLKNIEFKKEELDKKTVEYSFIDFEFKNFIEGISKNKDFEMEEKEIISFDKNLKLKLKILIKD